MSDGPRRSGLRAVPEKNPPKHRDCGDEATLVYASSDLELLSWGHLSEEGVHAGCARAGHCRTQECARPTSETDQCLRFGDNPGCGVAVFANGPYRIRAVPPLADVPLYCIPVEVTGPTNFLLIAV
jgi:hypothetical protein